MIDPFRPRKTLNLNCYVHDPITGEAYSRDPRNIARKAEAYLPSTGIADTCYFGPEAEFFIFDSARYSQTANTAFYEVDSDAAAWQLGRATEIDGSPNRAYKPRAQGGVLPGPARRPLPGPAVRDGRRRSRSAGVEIELQHHEVATGGQAEIDMRFDTLLRVADKLMLYKYIVKNVAWHAGKVVTFMPKPLFQDNGSGMHCHQSLWKDGEPLFYDGDKYAGLSRHGPLVHRRHADARPAPSWPSPRRPRTPTSGWCPGYEAPVNLVYSQRNRSAAVRIPLYSKSPKAKRLEFRCPDPSVQPVPGVRGAADGRPRRDPEPHRAAGPGRPRPLRPARPRSWPRCPRCPASLEASLDALEADHDFLLAGGVFTQDLIDTWIAYKRENEVDAIRLRPHPYEFHLYFDI